MYQYPDLFYNVRIVMIIVSDLCDTGMCKKTFAVRTQTTTVKDSFQCLPLSLEDMIWVMMDSCMEFFRCVILTWVLCFL